MEISHLRISTRIVLKFVLSTTKETSMGQTAHATKANGGPAKSQPKIQLSPGRGAIVSGNGQVMWSTRDVLRRLTRSDMIETAKKASK